ncbi:hypothetical protein LOC68_03675 [Blastopirellula sp. JC732]|uniref:Carboxypeptidase regulatory-like domain-containing protein n=1 Tax=Blastopirellula sediminis TaxID=2894196 RepID=A0A9X1MJI6_9BACT|nr:hypothetical protein [Blastopirellula sediminis]MCC9607722.1 hypothetical protein [Blastopirellula sediminis]MCC9627485.1 hypothetical protein [Blastopirellula sediminis]
MRVPFLLAQASLTAILLAGCDISDHEAGLVPVAGTVFLAGQPAPRGSVTFHEDPPRTGQTPIGMIAPDGTYRLFVQGKPGAMPGSYRVTVFVNEASQSGAGHAGLPKSVIDPKYSRKESTPLVVEVVKDAPADAYDLKLP